MNAPRSKLPTDPFWAIDNHAANMINGKTMAMIQMNTEIRYSIARNQAARNSTRNFRKLMAIKSFP